MTVRVGNGEETSRARDRAADPAEVACLIGVLARAVETRRGGA